MWVFILSLVGLGMAFFAAPSTEAQNVLNIGLLRFDAVAVEEGVRLEWDVETEIGTAGYTIKRGKNDNFEYLPDPEGNGNLFVLAEGGPAQAYSYTTLDETAVSEETYTYKLIEILDNSQEQEQAEVTITNHIEPTSTPITFSGDLGTPGSGGGQGPAETPTATQPPTATPRAQATATNVPPPTVAAPTPLPTATAVSPTAAPINSAPVAPTTAAGPESAYPAATAIPQNIENDAGENLPVLQDAEAQEVVVDALAEANEAPADPPQNSNPGQVSALEETALQAAPVVIGVPDRADEKIERRNEARQQTTDDEPENAGSSRILLWVAFIVALLIFSASVVGAILLYSRRRPLK